MVLSIDPLLSSSLAKAQYLDILLLAMDSASAEDLPPSVTALGRGYLHQTPDVLHIQIFNDFSYITFYQLTDLPKIKFILYHRKKKQNSYTCYIFIYN
jgi:hypothetical protein